MIRLVLVAAVVGATIAPAALTLQLSAPRSPSHPLPGMVAAYATLTVENLGSTPARVTDNLPPGRTVTAAAGEGWHS